MTRTLTLLLIPFVLLLAACERPAIHTERMLAFGTLVEVSIYTADEDLARAGANAVREDFEYMHRAWHPWQPGAMGRTNQLLAMEGWFSVSPSILPLLKLAAELEAASDGLFNPVMGELMEIWGFHGDEEPQAPPEEERIQEWLERAPSTRYIELDGIRARATRPGVRLDPGGFAKGYAVDRAMERLMDMGIDHAIINAGGDLRAIGQPGRRAWRIGIRHPDGEGVLASLELQGDESVYTSGDYERYFVHDGTRYHHILDPRTARPARETRSVTVMHHDGALADAASTALFVAGPERLGEIAGRMGVHKVMLVDPDGEVHMTGAMAERIRFEIDPAPTVHIVELSQ
ncbi:thiamine biosynthesis protein ApbE [Thioalkalivibrio denitrificans]|uniref:FAD:protein FMN transferase n=1 Tax=Thioalkalivibrio denitrificans TaxID=108003 RepID=A0A1V3NUG3_9GAMM|nr:FAD:protein FMN transferase [Thioalkalivibrio denitrificans]OOG28614.1 thiamine biosynthesis protein ApbE [Thioalkalivibrio denitrificans]